MAAYGADLAQGAGLGQVTYGGKRSEGHESHIVDGEVLIGRGWGREGDRSEIEFPSMFSPDRNFGDYRINKEENRFSRLEWQAQFRPISQVVEEAKQERALLYARSEEKGDEKQEI